MGICCENCFENQGIQKYITKNAKEGDCEYCKSKNVFVIDTKTIGKFIRLKLSQYYEIDDNILGGYFEDEDDKYNNRKTAFDVLNEIENIFSTRLQNAKTVQRIFKDFMTDSWNEYKNIKNEEVDWLDYGNALIERKDEIVGINENRFYSSWEEFKYQCKYYARFFDIGPEKSRESLLRVVAELLTRKELIVYLEKKLKLYRARIIDRKFDVNTEPMKMLKAVGPPPKGIVKNNRMSPAGIPYLYLANSKDVCFAEIRAKTNDLIAVAEFEITKQLKILDLTSLPNIELKSIFDVDYDSDLRWARTFMKSFTSEISRPIAESDADLEYLPTQLLAEYIRKLGFDGLQFTSSVNNSGMNYTLYCTTITETYYFEKHLPPFTDWLKLNRVEFFKVKNTFHLKSFKEYIENDFILTSMIKTTRLSKQDIKTILEKA